MDNFKIIYRILKELEIAMDHEGVDIIAISSGTLEISNNRWAAIFEMLSKEGYVEGVILTIASEWKVRNCISEFKDNFKRP